MEQAWIALMHKAIKILTNPISTRNEANRAITNSGPTVETWKKHGILSMQRNNIASSKVISVIYGPENSVC